MSRRLRHRGSAFALADRTVKAGLASLLALAILPAAAQEVLIRNATVHTATERGTLQGADVLVQNGRIAAVGIGLAAGSAQVVDAQGQPLTPAFFGGITGIGIEEVSGEFDTDASLAWAGARTWWPRVRRHPGLNPESILLPVRCGGHRLHPARPAPRAARSSAARRGHALDGVTAEGRRCCSSNSAAAAPRAGRRLAPAQWMLLDHGG